MCQKKCGRPAVLGVELEAACWRQTGGRGGSGCTEALFYVPYCADCCEKFSSSGPERNTRSRPATKEGVEPAWLMWASNACSNCYVLV